MTDPRPRDRAATEAGILAAAEALLVREGFAALSVQAVATAAGVDRKLVYRYFGGVEGVVDAIGHRIGRWLGDSLPEIPAGMTYGAAIRALLAAYVAMLRANPTLRRLLAWEIVAPSPMLAALDRSRSAAIQARLPALRGPAGPPPGVDAPAVNAVLLAAVQYLALREASTGGFAGLALDTPAGWNRVQAMLDAMVAAAYPPPTPGAADHPAG